jgi:hypothetical protein
MLFFGLVLRRSKKLDSRCITALIEEVEARAVRRRSQPGENARIPMNLHLPASQLASLFIASRTIGEAIDELKQPLLIFGVLVVVFLDLFFNWWMAGTP